MLVGLVAFATAAAVCYLIVRSVRWHITFTADHPGLQPQKFHTQPTPRVGGLGILAGMIVAGFALPLTPADSSIYWLLMFSLLPAFLGGFAEDLTRHGGVTVRLMLTFLTAGLAYALADVHFVRSDMGWLDAIIQTAPLGYLCLLFGVAGVAHATNLIDGYNGLAGGVAVIILTAMGFVAMQHHDPMLATFCIVAALSTLGFLLFNYPTGRLFMGDGGAYLLGSVIALAGAMLLMRHQEISPWFPLALVIYPVWETVFSAIRRIVIYGTRVGEPDAKHLHSLVYRRISRRWARGRRAGDKALRNSLTTLPFWAVNIAVASFAVAFARNTRAEQALAVLFIGVYLLAYWRMSGLKHHAQRRMAQGFGMRPARRIGLEARPSTRVM